MAKAYQIDLSARPDGGAIDLDDLKRKTWPTITAQFIRIAAPTVYDFKVTKSSNYIALHDIYRTDGMTSVPGLPRSYMKDIRNKITFVPMGCDVAGWAEISKPASYVAVFLDQTGDDKEPIDLAQLPPRLGFEDPMLRAALSRFQMMLRDPSFDTPGYAETLGALLAFELGRVLSRQRPPATHKGGLTARQARLVIDYIESHLTEQTTISELARLLDLTRFHFIRAFKQAVGMPPHRFMVERRIDRAKELLASGDISVSEIATQTGFNSATQLTKAFRRIVGTTPSVFRRESS